LNKIDELQEVLIAGSFERPTSTDCMDIVSPVDGKLIGTIPICASATVEHAAESAQEAQEEWRLTHYTERYELLQKAADLIEANKETFAKELTWEQGKPLGDSLIELEGCIGYFRGAAEDIKRLETGFLPIFDPKKRVITVRDPIGVIGVITPWNFPWDIPCFNIASILASGNSVILKPAEQTPLSGLRLIQCLQKAGFPKGTVSLVQGVGEVTGEAISSSNLIDGISFTGSTETGRAIARAGSSNLKRLCLELGGNGPMIILDDADLDIAVADVALSCFWNSGQVCNAGERILVQEKIHKEFLEKVLLEAKNHKLGNPFDEGVTMGPMNNEEVALKTDRHIENAKEKGAKILLGGKRASGFPTNLYFPPTVIDGVTTEMLLNKEETFGPVCPTITFEDMDDALRITESSKYGLQASVYTRSIKKAFYMAERIRTGTITVNEANNFWEGRLPWGGVRASGMGRVGGRYALEQYTEIKTIIFDLSKS
jgi:acyl-CoA reductase-like NAD-dependent aldehyde dehydrogenase